MGLLLTDFSAYGAQAASRQSSDHARLARTLRILMVTWVRKAATLQMDSGATGN